MHKSKTKTKTNKQQQPLLQHFQRNLFNYYVPTITADIFANICGKLHAPKVSNLFPLHGFVYCITIPVKSLFSNFLYQSCEEFVDRIDT